MFADSQSEPHIGYGALVILLLKIWFLLKRCFICKYNFLRTNCEAVYVASCELMEKNIRFGKDICPCRKDYAG